MRGIELYTSEKVREDYASTGRFMFSVGNLVAFEIDGYLRHNRCRPDQSNYFLQDEIVLKEGYLEDIGFFQKVVELEDVFWIKDFYHPRFLYTPSETLFLLQVLDSKENVFVKFLTDNNVPYDIVLELALSGSIAEVRNNPGKFLHIYEIPEEYYECRDETFCKTVSNINFIKNEEYKKIQNLIKQNYRDVELIFGITKRHGGKTTINFGNYQIEQRHEHDTSLTYLCKIKIMPSIPDGTYDFIIFKTSTWNVVYWASLQLKKGVKPRIYYCDKNVRKTNIQPGWILVNGKDVYDLNKEILNK